MRVLLYIELGQFGLTAGLCSIFIWIVTLGKKWIFPDIMGAYIEYLKEVGS